MADRTLDDVIRALPRGRMQPEDVDAVVASAHQLTVAQFRELIDSMEAAIEQRRQQSDGVDAVLSGLMVAVAVLRRVLL